MFRITFGRLLFAILTVALLLHFLVVPHVIFRERGYDIFAEQPIRFDSASSRISRSNKISLGETCSPFSNGLMDDVTIVIKLGAPEVASRLPSYLDTLLPCRPNLLLFSDRNDSIDGIEIVDALGNLRSEYKYKNPDFEIYNEIQRPNVTFRRSSGGWRLDKYKFLPMMEFIAHQRPKSSWYVFVELDTYVNWDNLYRFLSRFDSAEPHYFGSPVWPTKKLVFAHGGSGYILSQSALKRLVARGEAFAQNDNLPGTHLFGKDIQKECCGDEVLANVLKGVGVRLEGYWPMFNGENPFSLVFGHEQWCEAIITLHHLGGEDFDTMRRFEASRQLPRMPLTFKELFGYIEPSLTDQVDDWSNLSEDVTLSNGSAGRSFAACFNACMKDSKCIQCEHFEDTCRLSYSIRLGHKQMRWKSGWVKERIQSFRRAQPTCQEGARIVHPNP